jgi:hypothetical protein
MKPSVEINIPINKVVELFMDKRTFKDWKKNFISYEHISGTPGEVGAVTMLIYKRVTMLETIISKNLPAEIVELYEHKNGDKTVMVHQSTYRFTSLTANKTHMEVIMETLKIEGFMMKLIMTIFAGAGRKYAQEQLDKFKELAEKKS